MAKIELKRRYGKFFESKEEQELVFALYEDVDGFIHYKYCGYDSDTHIMKSALFFDEYTRSE